MAERVPPPPPPKREPTLEVEVEPDTGQTKLPPPRPRADSLARTIERPVDAGARVLERLDQDSEEHALERRDHSERRDLRETRRDHSERPERRDHSERRDVREPRRDEPRPPDPPRRELKKTQP